MTRIAYVGEDGYVIESENKKAIYGNIWLFLGIDWIGADKQ